MTSPDVGILTTDAALVVRSWNDWLERVTGIRAEDAIGRPLDTLAPGLDARGLLDRVDDVLRLGSVQVLSPVFHRYLIPCPPTRPSRFFERMQQHVTIGPLVGEEQTTGLVITIEDVTARLEQERTLAQANASEDFDAIAASLRDEDWMRRRATVEELSASAAPALLHALLNELRRNHRNFSALSSALRLLATTEHDLTEPLAALLRDPDPDLRMQVALALGEQRNPAAAEALTTALDDPDQNVRFHAIEALGRLRAASAVEALARIAESDDFFLAFAALDALALIHDPRVTMRLTRLLDRPDVREATIGMLAAIGDEQVCAPLALVINTVPEAVESAAEALVRIHERESAREATLRVPAAVTAALTPTGIDHLVASLDLTSSRSNALIVLGWLRSESLASLLARFVATDDRDVVIDALARLGEAGTERLLVCAQSEDDAVAAAAAAALGRRGSGDVTAPLLQLLDRGGPVGVAAAGALARIADPGAFGGLMARVGHDDAALRHAVIDALTSIGHPDLPARTVALLESGDPRQRESGLRIAGDAGLASMSARAIALMEDPVEAVRIAAIEHLPAIAGDDMDAHLSRRLRDEAPRARAAIVRSLGHYDTPLATSTLIDALRDPDMWVRYYAARALGGRRGPAITPALIDAASSPNPEPLRIAAIDALATTGGEDVERLVLAACDDPNPDVAAAGLRAAGAQRSDAAFERLQQAARGEPGARASAGFEGLARDGSPRAVEILQWVAASSTDDGCARACIAHLGQLARTGAHAANAVDALLSLSLLPEKLDAASDALLALPADRIADVARGLCQPSVALRRRAVSLLGESRRPEAATHLFHALDDGAPEVREAAVAALGQLGVDNTRERLARLANEDPSAAVRRVAADALSLPRGPK